MPVNDWWRNFVTEKVEASSGITSVDWISHDICRIEREEYPPFGAGIVCEKDKVELGHVQEIFEQGKDISCVSNVPRDGVWTGDAIEAIEARGLSWGRFGVLLLATSYEDATSAVDTELEFNTRVLRQHSSVKSIRPLFDRKYRLNLTSGKIRDVVFINEYELTAEHVRTAKERYGDFDDILKTNPNGNPTQAGCAAAEAIGVNIYAIRDYMSELRRL